MVGKRILIIIPEHLANAPRAQKEAAALHHAGAQVLIRGNWWDDNLAREDMALAGSIGVSFAPVVDIRTGFKGRLLTRIRQRIARELLIRFGWVTPRAFGIGGPEMLRLARRIEADLTMVHSEPGLWVASRLLSEGKCVGVDFDDWFSQDLLPADRMGRPVAALREMERLALRKAHVCLTTSTALATALAQDAGVARVPVVVPNCFPARDRVEAAKLPRDSRPESAVSFHWFSQTIGAGRGLECLAQALSMLRGEWSLSLRGRLGNQAWFEATFPETIREHIQILEPVANKELLARVMSHDVGLALEEPYCGNKQLTASNKIFEYLRAGLAVIATRTQGQCEVMQACPQAGLLVEPGDATALAQAMQQMIDDAPLRTDFQRAAFHASEMVWAWETHAPKLVAAVESALQGVGS